jgi:hypothetical protein
MCSASPLLWPQKTIAKSDMATLAVPDTQKSACHILMCWKEQLETEYQKINEPHVMTFSKPHTQPHMSSSSLEPDPSSSSHSSSSPNLNHIPLKSSKSYIRHTYDPSVFSKNSTLKSRCLPPPSPTTHKTRAIISYVQ